MEYRLLSDEQQGFDVIIVGAGISGISAAAHLEQHCPGKRYLILEAREAIGGTWDLFRYPGIRSDSDMHTFGFRFKPWTHAKAIADGPSILSYLQETVEEYGIAEHIRFNSKVKRASWQDQEACWQLAVENSEGEQTTVSGNLLFMCSGYYRYDKGYTPDFSGIEDFRGELIHPQHWPRDLDYRDKRVAVIGSGATAVTLVPAMAEQAASVTMVQRSPTWIVSRPGKDRLANFLNRVLPEKIAYAITRWRNIHFQNFIYKRARKNPEKVKQTLLKLARKQLGESFDIDRHFTPDYDPWTQRLCLIPDSDLFEALKSGRANVVTGQIRHIEADGIVMQSGERIPADILVTATGLQLQLLGGAEFYVNGEKVDFSQHYSWQGMMLSDIPNLVQTFGYINASWTLRADLNSQFVCDLIREMDARSARKCSARPEKPDMPARDFITGFNPGYMQRSMHLFPRQSEQPPWRNTQDYLLDRKLLAADPTRDPSLVFE
jgi:cation diffusion facilitator CzcD-associated flavoprotein CzcO